MPIVPQPANLPVHARYPRVRRYGDRAILVEFEPEISLAVNQKVIRLFRYLQQQEVVPTAFMTPAYHSLTIGIAASQINFAHVCQQVLDAIPAALAIDDSQWPKQRHEIPICYDLELGLDLEELLTAKKISLERLIELHTQPIYRVFMLGFLPGFAYLGTVDSMLQCSRKEVPRQVVPKGSVGIAGLQTGCYPEDAPGGWMIVGRTPLELAIDSVDSQTRVNFQPGDEVVFRAISRRAFEETMA